MGDSLPFDSPADVSALPVANVPAVPNVDDLPLLFSVPHLYLPPFLLRSRAATARFAIRLRSAADSFAALAFPPLLAILVTSASDRFCARAFPPRLPSACAFGFFFCAMRVSCLALSRSREKWPLTAFSSPAIPLSGMIPIRTAQILEWYRTRWQVELAFKRLKSLVQLGHLPKHDDRSSRAWLHGKLLVALLTQKLIYIGRDISPSGCILSGSTTTEPVA
jgi:hypothetical protein